MRSLGRLLLLCLLTLPYPTTAWAQLQAVPYVTGLYLPVEFVQDPSDPTVQYVVEQAGLIRVIKSGALQATPFLDLTNLVSLAGERGLLGLAFPSNYASSRRFFVYYTRQPRGDPHADGGIVVARYKRSVGNPLVADPSVFKNLVFGGALDYIPHSTFGNHNGGHLAFGPDGYLYVGVGDGGSGNDPFNSGQTFNTYLGKILRLDVSVADSDPVGFAVPASNPFVTGAPDAAQVAHSTWDLGLRNPWKFSFDEGAGGTGALVIGDVGQNAWEEINYEPASHGGRNYGWKNREGAHPTPGVTPVPPATLPLVDPVFAYDHTVGRSITGGYVYRGTSMRSAYRGRYFYADFVRGRVWSLGMSISGTTGEAAAVDNVEHTGELGGSGTLGAISSFGRDSHGELYVVGYNGTIFKIVDPSDTRVIPFNADGDAFKDVFLYRPSSGSWTIQHGTAPGEFVSGASGGWAPIWQISVADFNGDGLDDFFLYSQSFGVWVKAINTGSGFSYFSQVWLAGFTPFIVDLNGDGKSDVFIHNAATGVWVTCISVGAGTGGFDYGSGGWRPGWQVLPADFDGDHKTDFLLYDRADGAFVKAITRGNGVFAYYSGGWSPGWTPFIADLDGDSLDDVFLYSSASGIWFRATSTGNGTGAFNYVMGGWKAGWLVQPADFDGNGLSDFFLYDSNGQWFKVINNGAAFSYFTGGWSLWTTTIANLNADANSDVLLFDSGRSVWYQALTTTPDAFTYTTGIFPR